MNASLTGYHAREGESQQHALTSMVSMTQSVIMGGVFKQTNVHRSKTPMEILQEQVAHSAFHNSAQRIDAPRCHPNTRVVVKEKSYRWIMRSDTQSMNASILWLSGAAGGGKSAIAQSIAEQCSEENLLLASFFFSRSDPSRNHSGHFIGTIVYQIYRVVPQPAQELIRCAIEQDPLIWSRDIFTQFRILIVNPLAYLVHSGFFQDLQIPRVIIIDGLDECIDRMMQRKILELVLKSLTEWRLPFLFFIASRPEPEIKAVFERPKMAAILLSILLDEGFLPDFDIELFLRDKFQECCDTHPCRRHIPPEWPPDNAIRSLVQKSSGQFIYASVVVKYVTSIRHYPHRRLEVILNLRAAADSPFAELDAVYSQILSAVDDWPTVQRIISFRILFFRFPAVKDIETILNMEDGELVLAMSDMTSLLCILTEGDSKLGGYLQVLHASFEDYLFDSSRSKHYCVDRAESYYTHTKTLIQCILSADVEDFMSMAMYCNIFYSLQDCFVAIDLDSDISEYITTSFSISAVYNRVLSFVSRYSLNAWLRHSLPNIIRSLDDSKSSSAPDVRQHLLDDFDSLLSYHFNTDTRTMELAFNVALIPLVRVPNLIPLGAFSEPLRLDYEALGDADSESTCAVCSPFMAEGAINMISDYLCTPSRSHSHTVGPETFSEAAIYCLRYLCRHGAPAQMNLPVMSYRQRFIRKMYPWKWNQRFIFEEVRGPGVTPWMWLSWPWERKTVLEPYRYDIIYAHLPLDDWATPMHDSPVVYYRMRSERYWLALHYLTQFLPTAGDSDTLVEMCRTQVFASKSQDFPRKSRRAREAMREYLERWGHALY
ncbi:hypothetical protein D9619_007617 [Psilocybe cf. subviscida]|uniref:Nephrocystin 3-like N-terminal domain-containing protein n=1 Tax=Psilocybe cf. subviscida TaxID=2480587 RepID=A0A8H5EWU3_9AGAR|nr:hypothetical protein D9619_007617 [Psilocybe cf. subviscida]